MRLGANAMPNKGNVVLYLDKELIEQSKGLGFNLSRIFENHLKQVISQLSNQQNTQNPHSTKNGFRVVGLPGFEPGSIEPKSTSLDHASRQPLLLDVENIISVAS
jgi:post-segregation antitoxin (ccd killing protein)